MAGYDRGRNVTTVAVFAIIATIAFAFLFLHMTGRGLSIRRSDLYVRLVSADGLRQGDPVVFRGVQVGEVKRLIFDQGGGVLIKARLMEPVPVTQDGHATLEPVDLFGRKSLVLHQGDFGAALLPDGDTLAGATPEGMTARIAELSRNAERLTGDTTVLLVRQALDGATLATQSVARLADDMRALMSAQHETLAALTRSSAQVARNLEIATDTIPLNELRTQAIATTAAAAAAADRLGATAVSLQELLASLHRGEGTAGLMLRDRKLYDRTESLLASVEALVVDLKANPKRYISVSVF